MLLGTIALVYNDEIQIDDMNRKVVSHAHDYVRSGVLLGAVAWVCDTNIRKDDMIFCQALFVPVNYKQIVYEMHATVDVADTVAVFLEVRHARRGFACANSERRGLRPALVLARCLLCKEWYEARLRSKRPQFESPWTYLTSTQSLLVEYNFTSNRRAHGVRP